MGSRGKPPVENGVVSGPPPFIFQTVIKPVAVHPVRYRVLAFTPSSGRPDRLLSCIRQMQNQTVAVDHAVFINHPNAKGERDVWNYANLIRQFVQHPKGAIYIGYGLSGRQHQNYLSALSLANLNKYTLFAKVDDDDIYADNYIELAIEDWKVHQWQFSGCRSDGYIKSDGYHTSTLKSLGQAREDADLQVPEIMPPTYIMTRDALDLVMSLKDDGVHHEDQQWRRALAKVGISMGVRKPDPFMYVIHGGNFSRTPHHQTAEAPAQSEAYNKPLRWQVGMITAPRKVPTVANSLACLIGEGLNVKLYAEPDSFIPKMDGVALGQINKKVLGPLNNMRTAMAHMLKSNPNADVYAVFQDDIELTHGVKEWFDENPWPMNCPVVSLYTPNVYLDKKSGWKVQKLGYYRSFGALGYLFRRDALRKFVSDPYVLDMCKRTFIGSDAVVGEWATRCGHGLAIHSPSLIRHTGEESTLRSWKLGPVSSVTILDHVDECRTWSRTDHPKKIGIVGWNTPQGLGYINRDLVNHLPIDRWILPKHPRFRELPPPPGTRIIPARLDEPIENLHTMVSGLDWLMYAELPYIKHMAGASRECGVPNVCIPMWEWLHKDLDWLKYVDLFLCPTRACYDLLSRWRKEMGLHWDLEHMPWPVDTGRFQFSMRSLCDSFLFNNGTGGGQAYKRDGTRHPPRKGIDIIAAVAHEVPEARFIVRTQIDVPTLPDNVQVLTESNDNLDLYSIGAVSIQPSRYEGIGLQILESQACGIPVITLDAPPMNEFNPMAAVSCTKGSGRVFGERWIDVYEPNVAELARLVKQMIGADISAQSMAARQFIEEHHSWTVAAPKIMSIL